MSDIYLNQLRTGRTLFMTKSGLDSLRQKLDVLMRDRLEVVKRMRIMRDEDEDDPLALVDEVRRLEATESEATAITNLLQHVEPVIKPKFPQQVQIGSEVTLERDSKRTSYVVVCPLEIDIEANRISEESPLGCALLGKKLHDKVTVPVKGTEYVYEIVDIH